MVNQWINSYELKKTKCMKKRINSPFILFIILFAVVLTAGSCGRMDDTYVQFLEGGEKIYVAKADSLKLKSGRNRVELSWLLLSDPKVKKYKIYWNQRRDSLENTISKSDDVDTLRVIINNLPEGNQTFQIFTYDDSGNSSVKAEISGRVYGSLYEKSLLNATISKVLRKSNDLKIIWNVNQPAGLSVTEIKYLDMTNNHRLILNKNFKDTTTLAQFPLKGNFEFRSGFLPDSLAIDTFYVDFAEVKTN